MEVESHVVHCLLLAVPFVDAEIGDVVQSHLHILSFSDIHECWHYFGDFDALVFWLLQLSDGCFGTFIHKD